MSAPSRTIPALLLPIGLAGALVAAGGGGESEPIRYDRDIRPILSDRCFRCHGPDEAKRQKNLRLDLAESATADRGGYAAIVPGNPGRSELWRRVDVDDPEERMPPPDSNRRPLSADEKERVRRWIEEGAKYEPHWAFVPPERPPLPAVRDDAWCRNPVDRFVLARLEREGIAPSPDAAPETLIRRLFLDLTGLPPTPEEIDAFLADPSPEAYDAWVDRLLDEEPYASRTAERMAVPWLDAARYADTIGIHTDAGRQMWLWRDELLRALRENLPYDRFVTEQIAGDLLPDATESQKIASGFHRNHVATDEGGAIAEEYLVEYAVDRAATTGAVFLGLTLGCARCHEHKFDPVSQEDFYRFYSFFNSIDEPGLYSQEKDSNRAFEPAIEVPTPEQREERETLGAERERVRALLEEPAPNESPLRAAFLDDLLERGGLDWETPPVAEARSTGRATLAVQPDGSVLASGENPSTDNLVLRLRTERVASRLLLLEAIPDPSLPEGRIGRAENGNAVLTGVVAEAISVADPARREPVRFVWAWADHEQANGDFAVVNALSTGDRSGWAVDAHRREGGRVALFLADRPFGFEGGTDLVVRLEHRSVYARHVLGRVRLSLSPLREEGFDALAAAGRSWYLVGPFPADSGEAAFETAFGPEEDAALDLRRNFGFGNQFWKHDESLLDGRSNGRLPEGVNATYVAKRLFVPSPRAVEVSLGTDDGFRLFLDGREVASKKVDRTLEPDQDRVTLDLEAGVHVLVLKIVNTGGKAGFDWRPERREGELAGDLALALLPESASGADLAGRFERAWRIAFSPAHRERTEEVAALDARLAEIDARVPRTMVMKELDEPRETFVLVRGQYDRPDRDRPVSRGVPAALGRLPEGAPPNRLGLAWWMTAPENPLVARVAANRLWAIVFGEGIVRTSEDFGMQGEWPSHPGLLDWLSVEFRERGWDVRGILRLLVTSRTYRQDSRVRDDARERDPENAWLSFFPRRRLDAERVRDQALYVSGLLVEEFGGPSVKPYQPEGLWQEVSMPASNTRVFERGEGEDLWRRSLYTYWKRASPPPSMLTFDAPTRESCTIRRSTTNTPLQALVLWNDPQFVEAARALALRTLEEEDEDGARLVRMFRRCTGRVPGEGQREVLGRALDAFRRRYEEAPEDAEAVNAVGASPIPEGADPAELAAWTLLANALLSLDATITRS